MRRLGGLALAAVLVVAVTACGGGDDDGGGGGSGGVGAADGSGSVPDCPLDALEQADGPVEITYWHGMQREAETTLQQLTDQFNTQQDQVHVNLVNNGNSDQHQKFLAGLSTGDLPDILQHDATYLREMIDSR